MNAPATAANPFGSSAVAERKEASPVVAALAKAANAMKAVLPKHITPEKMSRLALSVLRTNRKLAETAQGNPESFVAAVLTAGQLGLELGVFGEGHLVPFGSEIAFIPGYQGLVKLALNSRMVVDIYAHEVRQNDTFTMEYGLHRTLVHKPLSRGGFPVSNEERGPVTGFYAVAELATGTRTFFPISLAEAERTRNESRGYQAAKKYKKDHPWDTHFEQMGRKTAIRRLCNLLPKSPELAAALAVDAANDRGATATIDTDFTVISGDDEVRTPSGDDEGGAVGGAGQTVTDANDKPKTGADALKAAVKKQSAAPKDPPGGTPGTPGPEDDVSLGIPGAGDISHVGKGNGAPAVDYEKLLARLHNGTDVDALDADASLIGSVPGQDRQNVLARAYQKRRTELQEGKVKK